MAKHKKSDDGASSSAFNCTVCNHNIVDGKESSVQCFKCEEWFHSKCTMEDEVFKLLTKINKSDPSKLVTSGVVTFLCCYCSIALHSKPDTKPTDSTEDVVSDNNENLPKTSSVGVNTLEFDKEKPGENETHVQTGDNNRPAYARRTYPYSNAVNHDRTSIAGIKNETVKSKEIRICSFYKSGRCRFGKSGKSANGQKCPFSHPSKCFRFCKYGFDRVKGCNRSCGYFHPVLCQSSLHFGTCYNEGCSYQHLLGTMRYSNSFSNSKPNYVPPKQNQYFSNNSDFPPLPVADKSRTGGIYQGSPFQKNHNNKQGVDPYLELCTAIKDLQKQNGFITNELKEMRLSIQGSTFKSPNEEHFYSNSRQAHFNDSGPKNFQNPNEGYSNQNHR